MNRGIQSGRWVFGVSAGLAAWAIVALVVVAERGVVRAQDAASAGFAPVMPLHSLMIEQDLHFENIRHWIRTADDPERFVKLRHEALALAEMGNINGYHAKANDHADYRQWAAELKTLGVALAGHAEKKDLEAAKESAKAINATCKACHEKYQ